MTAAPSRDQLAEALDELRDAYRSFAEVALRSLAAHYCGAR